MSSDNFINYEPEVLANMRAASVGFEYPDDEPEDIQAEIDARASELVWSLLSRLNSVKSTGAFAIWAVIAGEEVEVSKKGRELDVTKQAVSLAVIRARRKLEAAQHVTQEPGDHIKVQAPNSKQLEAYCRKRERQ